MGGVGERVYQFCRGTSGLSLTTEYTVCSRGGLQLPPLSSLVFY